MRLPSIVHSCAGQRPGWISHKWHLSPFRLVPIPLTRWIHFPDIFFETIRKRGERGVDWRTGAREKAELTNITLSPAYDPPISTLPIALFTRNLAMLEWILPLFLPLDTIQYHDVSVESSPVSTIQWYFPVEVNSPPVVKLSYQVEVSNIMTGRPDLKWGSISSYFRPALVSNATPASSSIAARWKDWFGPFR